MRGLGRGLRARRRVDAWVDGRPLEDATLVTGVQEQAWAPAAASTRWPGLLPGPRLADERSSPGEPAPGCWLGAASRRCPRWRPSPQALGPLSSRRSSPAGTGRAVLPRSWGSTSRSGIGVASPA